MKEKNKLILWIKEHKKQLVFAGISITTLAAVVLGIKNKEKLMELWDTLKESIKPTINVSVTVNVTIINVPAEAPTVLMSDDPSVPLEVSRHIRNLPEGWHASPEKIAAAREMNIVLQEGQTWVENYTKGESAA